MPNLIIIFLFLLGFYFLYKGAELTVNGAVSFADRLNIPAIFIGMTIVAFGTSAPELFINLLANVSGNTQLLIGNILGSSLANSLLILGIVAIAVPLTVNRRSISFEFTYATLSSVILLLMLSDSYDISIISRSDGFMLLSLFIFFLFCSYYMAGKSRLKHVKKKIKSLGLDREIACMGFGFLLLFLGGRWVVEGATSIALWIGFSNTFVGFVIIALGTSLPELSTSIVATKRKRYDVAVGNIVGSTIFNILFVLGITSVVKPIIFESVNFRDVYFLIIANFLVLFLLYIGKKGRIGRLKGMLLLLFYLVYVVFLLQMEFF